MKSPGHPSEESNLKSGGEQRTCSLLVRQNRLECHCLLEVIGRQDPSYLVCASANLPCMGPCASFDWPLSVFDLN